MTVTAKIALSVYIATLIGSTAYAAYYVRHIIKHGHKAHTPLEAWITARRASKDMDRALEEMLNQKRLTP